MIPLLMLKLTGLWCKVTTPTERLSHPWQRVIFFRWEVQDFGKGSVCCLLAGTHPSSPSKRKAHITLQRKELLSFRWQTNNWHLFFTVNIYYSTSEPLPVIGSSAQCTSRMHQAAIPPLLVTSSEGCERIRKNQCTYCSAPERQKNIPHFQWAFIQVSHLDGVPTALCQTPMCMHTASAADKLHIITHQLTAATRMICIPPTKSMNLLQNFYNPFPEKNLCTTQYTTMLTAKRYPQKMKSRIQMKGNTQQIKEAAYVFLTKLNGHKQRARGAMHGLLLCGISCVLHKSQSKWDAPGSSWMLFTSSKSATFHYFPLMLLLELYSANF